MARTDFGKLFYRAYLFLVWSVMIVLMVIPGFYNVSWLYNVFWGPNKADSITFEHISAGGFAALVIFLALLCIGFILHYMVQEVKLWGTSSEDRADLGRPFTVFLDDENWTPLVLAGITAAIISLKVAVEAFNWLSTHMPYFDDVITVIAYIIGGIFFLIWFLVVPPLDHTEGPY